MNFYVSLFAPLLSTIWIHPIILEEHGNLTEIYYRSLLYRTERYITWNIQWNGLSLYSVYCRKNTSIFKLTENHYYFLYINHYYFLYINADVRSSQKKPNFSKCHIESKRFLSRWVSDWQNNLYRPPDLSASYHEVKNFYQKTILWGFHTSVVFLWAKAWYNWIRIGQTEGTNDSTFKDIYHKLQVT